jgi:hypothetical protein
MKLFRIHTHQVCHIVIAQPVCLSKSSFEGTNYRLRNIR